MKKRSREIIVNRISNDWQYGVEIYAYSPQQQRSSKKMMWYNACNPECKEKFYDLSFIYNDIEADEDTEWIEDEFIAYFIEDYAELNNLDLNSAKIR